MKNCENLLVQSMIDFFIIIIIIIIIYLFIINLVNVSFLKKYFLTILRIGFF